jgi:hypothetical protein
MALSTFRDDRGSLEDFGGRQKPKFDRWGFSCADSWEWRRTASII